MFYNLILTPIEYILDTIFCVMVRFLDNYGLAIICVSLAVQFLTLPLYKKSDEIQEAERRKQKSMESWVSHIKKTFSGNERFMMLSTYYRQQNYKPIYALKGSVSLLLQIPFFIAAYSFLSNLSALEGQSFSFIKDLSAPDGLISIGSISINLLPILMTVINIVSGIIYTQGFTKKEKIQLYAMALLFLVLLYNSPSGLVLYWTMNNVFSLAKNIFVKLVKKPGRFLCFISPAVGAALLGYVLFLTDDPSVKANMLATAIFAFSCLPPILYLLRNRLQLSRILRSDADGVSADPSGFFATGLFLALFLGLFIPFSVVSSSPLEFFYKEYGPLNLIFSTTMTALGFFCIWGTVFYALGSQKAKILFQYLYWLLAAVFIVDFFFFGKNLGTVSPFMVFDRSPSFSGKQKLINLFALVLFSVLFLFVMVKVGKRRNFIFAVLCVSLVAYGMVSGIKVNSAVKDLTSRKEYVESDSSIDRKIITMSKNGKNVVLFMLDRAISGYIPYIMNEKPQVAEAFSDFVYYPNTMSYGGHTNFGAPAIFGGYEYSPWEINKRTDEKLVSKHNEALTVLPVLFMENGFTVTVCDPPYAGYSWVPDLSIYDAYPEINAYNLAGLFNNSFFKNDPQAQKKSQARSIFFYSILKASPLVIQSPLYDGGRYWTSLGLQNGSDFKDTASALLALPFITEIDEGDQNTFLMIQNDTPHEPLDSFSYPDYEYSDDADISDSPNFREASDGSILVLDTSPAGMSSYAVNMYSYLQLAKWIEYLKANGVYDNTRIIIVADHGHDLGQFDYMKLSNGVDVQSYNPVLLVKDFAENSTSSSGYRTDNSFMTNADAAVFAVQNLIDNPVNPFTGRIIDSSAKEDQRQMVTTSKNFLADGVTSNVFDTSDGCWYQVKDDIFDVKNWILVE
ncbi:MAG: membrane protein insertase YidC [Spirochaetales bacterium]|nr:membrane protein insertase YidC [Spirochaetales bacterium]